MKRIILLILMSLLSSFSGFAQFPEGFEGGVVPLTGRTISDNSVGTSQSWVINSASSHTGTKATFINTDDIGVGNTSEDWLTSPSLSPVCGGNFVDEGGIAANYLDNSDSIITIFPVNPTDLVTVTFTAFDIEIDWDALYVFDGNSIAAPQIASTNPAGNVPGNVPGGFWGTTIPGPFTSSAADGSLTFRFRSDGAVQHSGWVASVTCAPVPTCLKPTLLTADNITPTSALLGWTNNSTATQWEIIYVPFGSPIPGPTSTGTVVTVNSVLVTGLTTSTRYTFYVRAMCSPTDSSIWSQGFNFTTKPINDECSEAISVPVNSNSACNQVVAGSITNATASTAVPAIVAPCVGTPDDDVWFQFIATNANLNISLQNVVGTSTDLNFAVYSGTCGTLTQVSCSAPNALGGALNAFTAGQTYYLRVYSNSATSEEASFNLCISTPSTCDNAATACGATNYGSATGVKSLGSIGCLSTSPNPTFFTIQVQQSGPINFQLTNTSTGSTSPDLDVDYAAWGPYTSQAAGCASGIPNILPINLNPTAGGSSQDYGCSYSANSTEQFNIPNALAGEYYIILITNFSDILGTINLEQSNINDPGAGLSYCCPGADFSYTPGIYCKGSSSNPTAQITPGSLAGVFSALGSPPPVVFENTATGEIDLVATPAGNYVIVNTVAATADCTTVKTYTYTITIVNPVDPTTTIRYSAPTTYCNALPGVQTVTISGDSGGTFSVIPPIGLNINPTTGDITPLDSSPGNYTVSYNFPDAGCGVTSFTTTVEILPAIVPTFTQVPPICPGDDLEPLPRTSDNGIEGTWSPPTMNNIETTIYTFTPDTGECASVVEMTIVVNPAVVITIGQGCINGAYTLTATALPSDVSLVYNWHTTTSMTSLGTNSTLVVTTSGTYVVDVTSFGICSSSQQEVVINSICDIPKGISPNGDGKNDAFDLSDFNAQKVEIFNRYGIKVYTHGAGYTNQWHGQTDAGEELPDGTYYYVIDASEGQSKTGWVYINRER